jgi:hypothetical protein
MNMKMLGSAFAIASLIAPAAFAQSNGNFSASGTAASCAIGADGTFGTPGGTGGGTTLSSFTANISTSNGSGTTLDIRPSLVTGLFTDTKISTTVPSATAEVGIQVCVQVDGSSDGILPAPCVIYDERFQQISSQLFSQLTACTAVPTTIACGQVSVPPAPPVACPAGDTCNILPGAISGTCTAPNPLCNFELILSTLSAHSFDFVVPVGVGKPHVVTTSWSTVGTVNTNQGGSTASCVGPGIVTVTQVKKFNNSGSLSF